MGEGFSGGGGIRRGRGGGFMWGRSGGFMLGGVLRGFSGGWIQVGEGMGSGGGWGCSGGGAVQVGGGLFSGGVCSGGGGGGFRWGGGVSDGGRVFSWVEAEGSKGASVRVIEGEQKCKRWGGGESFTVHGKFLQFEFRFRNGLGRTLVLQSFRIT